MTPSASPPAAPHLTIGRAARAVGIAIDTIRYYEREGLQPVPTPDRAVPAGEDSCGGLRKGHVNSDNGAGKGFRKPLND